MKKSPLISIIIPVYNREKLVQETLVSVIAQTNENWECIVIDDGSTDKTWQVLETYSKKDNRIKPIKRYRGPKGANTCRNIGIENSEGEYLIFLDSDDLLAPWALEERVRFYEVNKNCDFIVSTSIEFKKHNSHHNKLRSIYKCNDPIKKFLSFQTAWSTCSTTWKKKALDLLEGWDENAQKWQDVELHVRALNNDNKFEWVSEVPDAFMRADTNFSRISNSFNVETIINNLTLFHNVSSVLINAEDRTVFRKNIELWIYHKFEFLNFWDSLMLLKAIKQVNNHFKLNSTKMLTYIILFHSTKKIPLIRRWIFSLREKKNFFPSRVHFYIKPSLDDKIDSKLKESLNNTYIQSIIGF
jgi:glycosyltransferase involved in cell wall biosynthesis